MFGNVLVDAPGKPVQHRVRPFGTVEVKSQVLLAAAALAVDDTVGGSIFAAHGDCLAFEINISVAVAAVGPVSDKNRIAIQRSPDGRLDRRVVVGNAHRHGGAASAGASGVPRISWHY